MLYVIMAYEGRYEIDHFWIAALFTSENEANKHLHKLNNELDKIKSWKCESCKDDGKFSYINHYWYPPDCDVSDTCAARAPGNFLDCGWDTDAAYPEQINYKIKEIKKFDSSDNLIKYLKIEAACKKLIK